jgi:4-hydroxybenzoate polyprenyltransferase
MRHHGFGLQFHAMKPYWRASDLTSLLHRYARLTRLDRPVGIWLLLWPTLWALWIAGAGRPIESVFLALVTGTIVVRSAGCVINDFADRKFDGLVKRTADRPLVTGEVAPAEALVLFLGLMFIALGIALTLNKLTILFACFGAAITMIYPFTKRFVSAPQFVLGIAFAWGVPMAFAAQLEVVPRVGWLLFLAAIVWGVVYDTQYAMVDRDDDLKIGVKSTAIMTGEMDRAFIGALQILLIVTLILVGRRAELGQWYFAGLGIASLFAAYQQYLIKDRDRDLCLRAFLNNSWFGAVVFFGILLDYVFRAPAVLPAAP